MQSRVTTGGRITLPKELRVNLGIEPGDKVNFVVDPSGHVVLRVKPLISGMQPKSQQSRSLPKKRR